MFRSRLLQNQIKNSASKTNVYVSGHGWTGALGQGSDIMTDSQKSSVSPSERDNDFISLDIPNVTNAAAGWGHTALITSDNKLLVCGRPYDFQQLMRLYRMPSLVRRLTVMNSMMLEKGEEPGIFAKIIDGVFRNNDKNTIDEYKRAIFPNFIEFQLPNDDVPVENNSSGKTLAASAGLTAVIGESGKLYTFGLNQRGQCGIGNRKTHHVWEPQPVIMKKLEDVSGVEGEELQDIVHVDLGLQHVLALNKNGELFGWGKGSRGQLGQAAFKSENYDDGKVSTVDLEYAAIPIDEFEIVTETSRDILRGNDANVTSAAAGWNHSACITESNHAFIWGKNAMAEMKDGRLDPVDAPSPTLVKGLPSGMKINNVSCGSHHTAFLMEDNSVYALGIATDTAMPIGEEAVQVVPPGLVSDLKQFTSHHDRTTIVTEDDEVLELQMWSTDELRSSAIFEPEWVEEITSDGSTIESVHRGWLHSLVLTST